MLGRLEKVEVITVPALSDPDRLVEQWVDGIKKFQPTRVVFFCLEESFYPKLRQLISQTQALLKKADISIPCALRKMSTKNMGDQFWYAHTQYLAATHRRAQIRYNYYDRSGFQPGGVLAKIMDFLSEDNMKMIPTSVQMCLHEYNDEGVTTKHAAGKGKTDARYLQLFRSQLPSIKEEPEEESRLHPSA